MMHQQRHPHLLARVWDGQLHPGQRGQQGPNRGLCPQGNASGTKHLKILLSGWILGQSLGAGASFFLRTRAKTLSKIMGLREPEHQGGTNNCETRRRREGPSAGAQKATTRLCSSEGQRAKDPSHDTAGQRYWDLPTMEWDGGAVGQQPLSWADGGAGTHGNTLSAPCTEMLPRPTVMLNQTQVLENGTFTLRCNTSLSADTVLWLRDGAPLAPSERLVLSLENRTLTVLGVTRGDAGAYQCEVRNPISTNRSEPSTVTVAYGPDSAKIDQSGSMTLGSPLTLTCVADSVPAPSYRWVLNGTDTNKTGSSLTFNSITQDHQGTYTCQAHNPITSLSASSSVAVRLTSAADSSGGLSPGAIAGIVIGSLIAVALLGCLVYFLLCRTERETKQHSPVRGQAAPAQNEGVSGSKPTLGEEDIQYSTLAFSAGDQKPPPGPQTPREGGTVYSEIRKK